MAVDVVEGFELHFPETPDADTLDDEAIQNGRDDDDDAVGEDLGNEVEVGDLAVGKTVDDGRHEIGDENRESDSGGYG